jgi:hypothetical protein
MSHMLTDARSTSILLDELAAAYDCAVLAEAPTFAQMIRYISSTPRAQTLASWTAMLDGLEPCEFPVSSTAHRQEARETLRQISYATKHKVGIVDFCRKAGIVPSAFLLTAWGLVLSHYTGMHDVCFGYMTSGRDALVDKVDALVGPLANLLISRVNLRDTVRQVLRTTSKRSAQHLAIQHASLAEIQHHLRLSGRRLFNTSLSINHQGTNGVDESKRGISFDIQGGEDAHEVRRTQFPLHEGGTGRLTIGSCSMT